jgi:hypothetical protein
MYCSTKLRKKDLEVISKISFANININKAVIANIYKTT